MQLSIFVSDLAGASYNERGSFGDNRSSYAVRSRVLQDAYHDTSQFYCGRAAWRDQRMNFEEPTIRLVLPSYRVRDIDTIEDRQRAK